MIVAFLNLFFLSLDTYKYEKDFCFLIFFNTESVFIGK